MANVGMSALGSFTIDEIIYAVGEKLNDGGIIYALDQLQSASIEITAESTDITDKKGNIVRRSYKSKTGTFTATNALLNINSMNVQSGSEMKIASEMNPLDMPKIEIVPAGSTIYVKDLVDGTLSVKGLFANGANGITLLQSTDASAEDGTFGLTEDGMLTLPGREAGYPEQYMVKYMRTRDTGIILTNDATTFPTSHKLTLMCSYVDLCSGMLRACYVVLPSFMPDPSMTISLSSDEQTIDFSGTIQMDYCSCDGKNLYYIYFPDEDYVSTGSCDDIRVDELPDNPDDEDPLGPDSPEAPTAPIEVNNTNLTAEMDDPDNVPELTDIADLKSMIRIMHNPDAGAPENITDLCTFEIDEDSYDDTAGADPQGQDVIVKVTAISGTKYAMAVDTSEIELPIHITVV